MNANSYNVDTVVDCYCPTSFVDCQMNFVTSLMIVFARSANIAYFFLAEISWIFLLCSINVFLKNTFERKCKLSRKDAQSVTNRSSLGLEIGPTYQNRLVQYSVES